MFYTAAMPTLVIATKLFIPPPRPDAVPRPALVARLNAGLHRKLTLLAAPAGFGKTSLASAWLADCGRPAAWLSLDEGDADPARFLAYLIAALQTLAPTIGADVLALLQSSPPPSIDALLPLLLNQIATLPRPAILVLDDYHLLDSRPIDQALAVLVEHLPAQLHLVILTREDPPLPLARLRARDQLTELRAADVRFTPAEASAFLQAVMGLSLSAADIATLEARTEGWIAGLQLAALSLQGHQDPSAFIRAFAGDHRYILDYLGAEVLQRQPEPLRRFLLQTAILDRLNGPLCDAVTGQERGQAQLEALERGNFFVVPLDDTRQWYRYHHLFAEMLAAQLRAEQPDLLATLHQRASAWHAQHGAAADAIRHALAAQDFVRAADLVELAAIAMSRSRQEATLLSWLRALPNEGIRARPVLSVTYAHLLLDRGELDGVEARLRDAEWWLDTTVDHRAGPGAPAAAMIVRDETTFRRLPGAIAIARAGLALGQGDVPGTVAYAQQALTLAPADDPLTRGAAAGFLGLAAWRRGDLDAAHQMFATGMASLHQAGNIADTINGATTLAAIRIAQGRLRAAMQTYERGLQLATEQGGSALRGTADLHVGMSEIACERNELPAAMQHLLHSQQLGEHTGFPHYRYRWRVAMARLQEALGDLDAALDLLDEAAQLYVHDFSPHLRPIAALKTRVWLAQGRLDEAGEWVHTQGVSVEDALSYEHAFVHITLARVLLARSTGEGADRSVRDAIGLLERLLHAADAGHWTQRSIEILVLLSLAHQAHGDLPAALAALSCALTLAEPEGYARVFVDEGAPMLTLLCEVARHGIRPDYTSNLLAAFPNSGSQAPLQEPRPAAHSLQSFEESLSQRELAVLRLFATELSGPEIARELMVALSTVRTYTKSIYSKLDVNNRRAAVKRATELGLL